MLLGSTQPLTDMSTSNNFWGVKVAGAYGWQPYHLPVPIVLKYGSLSFLEPSGSVQACNGIVLPCIWRLRVCCFWTFVDLYQITRRHIPDFHNFSVSTLFLTTETWFNNSTAITELELLRKFVKFYVRAVITVTAKEERLPAVVSDPLVWFSLHIPALTVPL